MTREEAIEKLKELQTWRDSEVAHEDADTVICELLESLGFADVVDEYAKVDKWYA
ncbi:hypothetical protein ITZ04_000791 [Escherichia coli]|uniref:hypothetical protein n=1 Tax=Enterobacter cloacae complex sp. 2021EL-01169 TaxID=2887193 RepID=UPI0019F79E80|nr:hypothetical protein [Enterobacter cloacae complex sp. 2021EL-01169]EGO4532899.1 hypothetical protein [Escherichia coli]MCC3240654.1 hypothetical protein [Enterobacter cloacae complex sp. 2021EL-01169]